MVTGMVEIKLLKLLLI